MRTDFVSAAGPAWLLVAGLGTAVGVFGLLSTSARARRTVARTAALFDDDARALTPGAATEPPRAMR